MQPKAYTENCSGFDIVERFDGSWAVYDYRWWPDDYLDNEPGANAKFLSRTGGWRKAGWIIVKVCGNLEDARSFCNRPRKGSR